MFWTIVGFTIFWCAVCLFAGPLGATILTAIIISPPSLRDFD